MLVILINRALAVAGIVNVDTVGTVVSAGGSVIVTAALLLRETLPAASFAQA
jgi:hypothetical protein